MFLGFNLAFFPMHVAGLAGMPRRVATYADGLGWNLWNLLSSAGAFVFAAGVALCLADLLRMLARVGQPHGDPWRAPTLEWLPQGDYGSRSIPQVSSRDPLWHVPTLAREAEQGRHWLPGTVFGHRETLITSPVRAELRQLLRMPGDGWLPFVAAAGTAGFFLLLTVAWLVPAFIAGALAVAAIVAWLWGSDRPAPAPHAQVGEGVTIATTARATVASHSWWAMVLLAVVDLSIWASLAFAHVHVALALDACPPAGARLPGGAAWIAALLLTGSAAMAWAARRLGRGGQGWLRAAVALALLASIGAIVLDLALHRAVGLSPRADAWSATIAALQGWQVLHALVLLAMGSYVLARSGAGRLLPQARATLDNTALMWHLVTLQTVAASVLVRALPVWLA
jgi:cytochrome c oxidase subunit I+III